MSPSRMIPTFPNAELANPSLLGTREWLNEGDKRAAEKPCGHGSPLAYPHAHATATSFPQNATP